MTYGKEDMMARQSSLSYKNGTLFLNNQVAVALRRLSFGESLSIIGDTFRMNQSTYGSGELSPLTRVQQMARRNKNGSTNVSHKAQGDVENNKWSDHVDA
ncbi:hypothetical protein GOBAR_DD04222 [Gossypium barbadense]|nr:hypothetical protein GOBAR_DD04222 [Gossypium barbadense]